MAQQLRDENGEPVDALSKAVLELAASGEPFTFKDIIDFPHDPDLVMAGRPGRWSSDWQGPVIKSLFTDGKEPRWGMRPLNGVTINPYLRKASEEGLIMTTGRKVRLTLPDFASAQQPAKRSSVANEWISNTPEAKVFLANRKAPATALSVVQDAIDHKRSAEEIVAALTKEGLLK